MNPPETKTPSVWCVMRQALSYHPLQQTAAGLMWTFFWMYPLVPGLLAKAFFDLLAGNPPFGWSLPAIVALMAAAALARAACVYLNVWLGETLTLRMLGLFQRNILARIFEMPGASALPCSVGTAISTLRDDISESMFLTGWLFDLIGWSIFVVGGLVIMLSIDWQVTLLVFGPLIAGIALLSAARRRVRGLREQSRAASAQISGSIGELTAAVQAIQVAGAEDQVIAHFRRQGEQRRQAVLSDRLFSLALDAVMANVASLGAGLTLLAASARMQAAVGSAAGGPGAFTVSDFALFSTYLMQVTGMAGFIGYLVSTYQQASVHIHRAVTLLQGSPPERLAEHHPIYIRERENPDPPQPPALPTRDGSALQTFEARGLTLRFPPFQEVGAPSSRDSEACCGEETNGAEKTRRGGIEDVSFRLERGTLTVITGRVGSGKTTLLRACLGLLEPQSGALLWNGQVIDHPAEFLTPPRAAYTPQVPTLLSGTLRENILLGLAEDDAASSDEDNASRPGERQAGNGHETDASHLTGSNLLTATGRLTAAVYHAVLERDLAEFPHGLETLIGARGVRLSGGQIQRTAAARMFVRPAELLVLDDISSALDVETERLLWKRLFDQRASNRQALAAACLVVSHRRAVLERADQILVMEYGRITARGRLEELLETSEEMRKLFAAGPVQ